MGFLSNIFGKKTCVLCGQECGVLKREKLRGGEYICSDCDCKCSQYIRVGELTLDEIKEHIGYMAGIVQIDEKVFSSNEYSKEQYPTSITYMGIQFCDELGMLKLINSRNRTCIDELIRYDQIASYKDYEDIDEPSDDDKNGKPKLKEAGIILTLVQPKDIDSFETSRGTQSHPYIKREIRIAFTKDDDRVRASDKQRAIEKLDRIFGVHDNTKGLFDFGMSKEQKRDLLGTVGMIKAMGTIAKKAATGETELTDEERAKLAENFNAVEDAQTGGLAVYTRRADEAVARSKEA